MVLLMKFPPDRIKKIGKDTFPNSVSEGMSVLKPKMCMRKKYE